MHGHGILAGDVASFRNYLTQTGRLAKLANWPTSQVRELSELSRKQRIEEEEEIKQ